MNRRPFLRTVFYLGAIFVLLVPLFYLSQPATVGTESEPGSPGGLLARMRDRSQLGQANLGEIDPASETMKLATLGLKGVAANILWRKTNEQKMKEDWTGLSDTLDKLLKLQPNYISVWRFQGWNLSYNVSVEWDDYKDRYFWIKEGIKFLEKGAKYNNTDHRLVSDTGWFTSKKFGTSDERLQYRVLFHQDDDEEFPNHKGNLRSVTDRDNWLVGKEYFLRAHEIVADRGGSLLGMNPMVFYSHPALCQINYAAALEEEGTFEEKARVAWEQALKDWEALGSRELPSTSGLGVRLHEKEAHQKRGARLVAELEQLAPSVRAQILAEKYAKLSAAEREARDTPLDARSEDDHRLAFLAEARLQVTHGEVAARVQGQNAPQAKKLAAEATRFEELAWAIDQDRQQVNYDYWLTRCRLEQTSPALEARRLLYDAKQASIEADSETARKAYEAGFAKWRLVLDEYPEMVDDRVAGDDIDQTIIDYQQVLKQLDAPFPDDFILQDVIDARLPPSDPPPEDPGQQGT